MLVRPFLSAARQIQTKHGIRVYRITNFATSAVNRIFSKRCAKLVSENTCCKNELWISLMTHHLTYSHPWNRHQWICARDKTKQKHKHMVSTAILKRSRENSQRIWKQNLPTTRISLRSQRLQNTHTPLIVSVWKMRRKLYSGVSEILNTLQVRY